MNSQDLYKNLSSDRRFVESYPDLASFETALKENIHDVHNVWGGDTPLETFKAAVAEEPKKKSTSGPSSASPSNSQSGSNNFPFPDLFKDLSTLYNGQVPLPSPSGGGAMAKSQSEIEAYLKEPSNREAFWTFAKSNLKGDKYAQAYSLDNFNKLLDGTYKAPQQPKSDFNKQVLGNQPGPVPQNEILPPAPEPMIVPWPSETEDNPEQPFQLTASTEDMTPRMIPEIKGGTSEQTLKNIRTQNDFLAGSWVSPDGRTIESPTEEDLGEILMSGEQWQTSKSVNVKDLGFNIDGETNVVAEDRVRGWMAGKGLREDQIEKEIDRIKSAYIKKQSEAAAEFDYRAIVLTVPAEKRADAYRQEMDKKSINRIGDMDGVSVKLKHQIDDLYAWNRWLESGKQLTPDEQKRYDDLRFAVMSEFRNTASLYDPATGRLIKKGEPKTETSTAYSKQFEMTAREMANYGTDKRKIAAIRDDAYYEYEVWKQQRLKAEEKYKLFLGQGMEAEDNYKKAYEYAKLKEAESLGKYDSINLAYFTNSDPTSNIDINTNKDLVMTAAAGVAESFGGNLDTAKEKARTFAQTMQEGGVELTPQQIAKTENSLAEDVVYSIGAVLPDMITIGVTSTIAPEVAAIRASKMGQRIYGALGKFFGSQKFANFTGDLITQAARGYITYLPSQSGGSTGVGETVFSGFVWEKLVDSELVSKWSPLLRYMGKVALGTTGETLEEFAGAYSQALAESGFDFSEAASVAFGNNLSEFERNLAVIAASSFALSGVFNLSELRKLEEVKQEVDRIAADPNTPADKKAVMESASKSLAATAKVVNEKAQKTGDMPAAPASNPPAPPTPGSQTVDLMYDNPLASVEEKKADIERRRQEELKTSGVLDNGQETIETKALNAVESLFEKYKSSPLIKQYIAESERTGNPIDDRAYARIADEYFNELPEDVKNYLEFKAPAIDFETPQGYSQYYKGFGYDRPEDSGHTAGVHGSHITLLRENVFQQGIDKADSSDLADDINAKYDAELSNLEKEASQTGPQTTDNTALIEQAKTASENIQGMYKDIFQANPEGTLFEAAVQANSSESEKAGAVSTFGQEIVDIAQKMFPDAKVGQTIEEYKAEQASTQTPSGPQNQEIKFGTAFDMQEATAETTVGKEKDSWGKAQVWRERIENAGDILRELSSRGDKPDFRYLMEKVKKLRDWIAESKKGYTPIDDSIKTIEDFEKTSLRWSNAVDSRAYLEKFHSDILDKVRREYEAIPTYTKEQRLALELILDLINNNIEGLESKLNEIENISNQIKVNGTLPIVADIKLPKVEQASTQTSSGPQTPDLMYDNQQVPPQELEQVSKKTGIIPKTLASLYKVSREIFGLDKIQSLASAIVMDRMVGTMAKRAGISKDEMYNRLSFEKTTESDLQQLTERGKTLKQIVGENAKLSDDIKNNLQVARDMEAAGKSVEAIRLATGWEKGVDGKWRYEVPDNIPMLDLTAQGIIVLLEDEEWRNGELRLMGKDVIPSNLLQLYPQLANIVIEAYTDLPVAGQYFPNRNKIQVRVEEYSEDIVSIILHELQHAIQKIEGFSRGDNHNNTTYEKAAGEVEARNVQTRMDMTPEERRTTPLFTTEDVARDEQIVLFQQTIPQGVKLQVAAFHGSPYQFDKFTTEKIGTGEGAQAFGWGLYFTDLESIARNYADKLGGYENSIKNLNTTEGAKAMILDALDSNDGSLSKSKSYLEKLLIDINKRIDKYYKGELRYSGEKWFEGNLLKEKEDIENGLKNIDNVTKDKNLYKVSLHEGKTPDQYTWLEWDKELGPDNTKKIKEQFEKENIPESIEDKTANRVSALFGGDPAKKSIAYRPDTSITTGKEFYNDLVDYFIKMGKQNPQKQASEFLLRAGIDGIKYPAESIARGATSDTARGFNYVVFDENAVSIEEVIKFQKEAARIQGAVMTTMDGTAIIYAVTDPNVTTPLHEMAHVFEHYLTAEERAVVQDFAGTQEWTTQTSEVFARGFEKYLADGKAPTSALQKIFDLFKKWLTDIYRGIKDSEIDIELNNAMRNVYAKMLGEGELVRLNSNAKVEAEKQMPKLFAKIADKLQQVFPNSKIVTFNRQSLDSVTFINENGVEVSVKSYLTSLVQGSSMQIKEALVKGFRIGDTVYINEDAMDTNVLVHEFAHIWENLLTADQRAYGIEMLKQFGSQYIRDVNSNPAYKNKSEEYRLREALVTAIGDMGKRMEKELGRSKFINWIKAIMDKIMSVIGVGNTYPMNPFSQFLRDAVLDMTQGEQRVQGTEDFNTMVTRSSGPTWTNNPQQILDLETTLRNQNPGASDKDIAAKMIEADLFPIGQIAEVLGFRFTSNFQDAVVTATRNEVRKNQKVLSKRMSEASDRLLTNVLSEDDLKNAVISLRADKYSDFEIYAALYSAGYGTDVIQRMCGEQYHKTIQDFLDGNKDLPIEVAAEFSADARTLKVSRSLSDLLGEVGDSPVDPAIIISYFNALFAKNSVLGNMAKLIEMLKEQMDKGEVDVENFINVADMASVFGRGLQLLRGLNNNSAGAMVEAIVAGIQEGGRDLTPAQRAEIVRAVDQYVQARKNRTEKGKELDRNIDDGTLEDRHLEELERAQKEEMDAVVKLNTMIMKRHDPLMVERFMAAQAKALLSFRSLMAGLVGNAENWGLSQSYPLRLTKSLFDKLLYQSWMPIFGSAYNTALPKKSQSKILGSKSDNNRINPKNGRLSIAVENIRNFPNKSIVEDENGVKAIVVGKHGNVLILERAEVDPSTGKSLPFDNAHFQSGSQIIRYHGFKESMWRLGLEVKGAAFKRSVRQIKFALKHGFLSDNQAMKHYEEVMTNVNIFDEMDRGRRILAGLFKKVSNKSIYEMTDEEFADAFDLTIKKYTKENGDIEYRLPNGKTSAAVTSLLSGMAALLGTPGEVSMRAIALSGDRWAYNATFYRSMIDLALFQGITDPDRIRQFILMNQRREFDETFAPTRLAEKQIFASKYILGYKNPLIKSLIAARLKSVAAGKKLRSDYRKQNMSLLSGAGAVNVAKRAGYNVLAQAAFLVSPFVTIPINVTLTALKKTNHWMAGIGIVVYNTQLINKYSQYKEKFHGKTLSDVERREEKKAAEELFELRKKAVQSAMDFGIALVLQSVIRSFIESGAAAPPPGEDREKDAINKVAKKKPGTVNISHYLRVLNGESNAYSRWREDDVTFGYPNLGTFGFGLVSFSISDAMEKMFEREKSRNSPSTTKLNAFSTGIGSLFGAIDQVSLLQSYSAATGLFRELASGKSAAASENFTASLIKVMAAPIAPNFFSFLSRSEGVERDNLAQYYTGENPSDSVLMNSKPVLKAWTSLSGRMLPFMRSPLYRAAIGPLGEDLRTNVGFFEPDSTFSWVQMALDPFTLGYPVKDITDEQKKNTEIYMTLMQASSIFTEAYDQKSPLYRFLVSDMDNAVFVTQDEDKYRIAMTDETFRKYLRLLGKNRAKSESFNRGVQDLRILMGSDQYRIGSQDQREFDENMRTKMKDAFELINKGLLQAETETMRLMVNDVLKDNKGKNITDPDQLRALQNLKYLGAGNVN